MAVAGLKKIALLVVLALAVETGWAMQRPGAPPPPPQDQNAQQNGNADKSMGPRIRMHGPGPHVGDWLRRHRGMSWNDQEHALEQDPQFKQLDPQRQEHLVEQLRKFHDMPPEQQQRILQRIETFEHLTPEQQARTRRLYHTFRQLPDLKQAFAELKNKSPEERQQLIDSDGYRSKFSPLELDILRDAAGLADATPQ